MKQTLLIHFRSKTRCVFMQFSIKKKHDVVSVIERLRVTSQIFRKNDFDFIVKNFSLRGFTKDLENCVLFAKRQIQEKLCGKENRFENMFICLLSNKA